eukprot:6195149-Pleurochrysis_carterae.AAC.1
MGSEDGDCSGTAGVATAARGVQLLCKGRCGHRSSCLSVKAEGLTIVAVSGSPHSTTQVVVQTVHP